MSNLTGTDSGDSIDMNERSFITLWEREKAENVAEETTLSRGERTRLSIMDAALELFIANGYAGTSMRQIARSAHIALGGIYNHFTGKEDLFRALVGERIPYPQVIGVLKDVPTTTGPQMIWEALKGIYTLGVDYTASFALMITDMREFEGKTMRIMAQEVMPELGTFLARARAAGGLREDVDLFVAMRTFISMMIGFMVTDMVAYKGDEPLLPGLPQGQEVRDGILDVLLYGLARAEGEA
jgi:AcrR family transcriptional regulator